MKKIVNALYAVKNIGALKQRDFTSARIAEVLMEVLMSMNKYGGVNDMPEGWTMRGERDDSISD